MTRQDLLLKLHKEVLRAPIAGLAQREEHESVTSDVGDMNYYMAWLGRLGTQTIYFQWVWGRWGEGVSLSLGRHSSEDLRVKINYGCSGPVSAQKALAKATLLRQVSELGLALQTMIDDAKISGEM
jgi:hypothetical protein